LDIPITRIGNQGLIPADIKETIESVEPKESFSDTLKKFVNDVNSLQNQASESIEKLSTGEIKDVHQVMIAVEEAGTAMEFMVEIRNKIVEAYQEIMRMPV
jgi:flagellar hook-basal body complex protein FliE